jgi:hypothetical protein
VERTQAAVLHTTLSEVKEVANNIYYIRSSHDFLNGEFVDVSRHEFFI